MVELEHLAHQVVVHWDSRYLALHVQKLGAYLEQLNRERQCHQADIDCARKRLANDDCEIDERPLVSVGNGGVFVNAWLWVASGTTD